jgi:hypothetical protein
MGLVFSILVLVLMVGALIDIITARATRWHLPKVFWIILVIIVPLAGSPSGSSSDASTTGRDPAAAPAERRPARLRPPAVAAADTRSTEQQIADLDREIEEWRLRGDREAQQQDGTDAG